MNDNDFTLSLFDEDEEDIEGSLSPALFDDLQQTIVYNLDWTVETLLSQLKDFAIDLQPQYQRRDAWTVGRKSKLIESLILGLPIPHVVLAERRDEKGTFLILDGKQRLTCLAQFSGNLPTSPLNGFALKEVPLLPQLEGITYDQLLHSEGLKRWKTAFLNQPIRTAILRGWQSEDLLHLVFHRLNSEVVVLSPQELRQAIIRGPFMAFLNDYSAQSLTLQWLLNLKGPDFRMRDSELLLRLLGLTKYQSDYRGDLRKFLDRLARKLSEHWISVEGRTREDLADIELALERWSNVLGKEYVGRKFAFGSYEGRMNRAVLDAQVYAALDPTVAQRMATSPSFVRAAFENMMEMNFEFRRAVEATTKSMEAVRYRCFTLREALKA